MGDMVSDTDGESSLADFDVLEGPYSFALSIDSRDLLPFDSAVIHSIFCRAVRKPVVEFLLLASSIEGNSNSFPGNIVLMLACAPLGFFFSFPRICCVCF